MEEKLISIEEVFESLKKRWLIIVAITLTVTFISGLISFFLIKPKYAVSTKVFVGKEEGEDQKYNQSDILMYQKLLKTYSETIKSKDLVDKAVSKSGTKLTTEEILGGLTVNPVKDTQILEIKLRGLDNNEIKKALDGVTEQFITTSKELVPNGNIRIIESSEIPQSPISPNKVINISIAFLIGFMVSVLVCFLLEFFDNTYKIKEKLEIELEFPVLGTIPSIEDKEGVEICL